MKGREVCNKTTTRQWSSTIKQDSLDAPYRITALVMLITMGMAWEGTRRKLYITTSLQPWGEMCTQGTILDAISYYNIAHCYLSGEGVEMDMKKATHYYELAAMIGHVKARHNLGIVEENAGNMDRAMKHYMISAGAGCDDSLEAIRECFMNGDVAKG